MYENIYVDIDKNVQLLSRKPIFSFVYETVCIKPNCKDLQSTEWGAELHSGPGPDLDKVSGKCERRLVPGWPGLVSTSPHLQIPGPVTVVSIPVSTEAA